jgi:hypothetical protein
VFRDDLFFAASCFGNLEYSGILVYFWLSESVIECDISQFIYDVYPLLNLAE